MRRTPRVMSRLIGLALVWSALALPGLTPGVAQAQGAAPESPPPAEAAAAGDAAAGDAPAAADPVAEKAKGHFLRGVELYSEADYRGALIEFQRAYDTLPRYQVLFNLGVTRMQLQDYAGALRHLNRYLSEGGDQVPEARRVEVEAEIARLQNRVGRLEVTVNREGVEIWVDEEKAGLSPLSEAVLVGVGRRRVTARDGGQVLAEYLVDVASGDQVPVKLELAGAEVVEVVPPPGSKEAEVQPGRRVWPYWVAAGTLALGASITGVLAVQAEDDLKSARERFPGDRADIDEKADRASGRALAADALWVGALLVGSYGLYLVLTEPEAEEGVSVQAGVGPGMLTLGGRF